MNEMAKGPWVYGIHPIKYGQYANVALSRTERNELLAMVTVPSEKLDGYVTCFRLMAAAPELLAACQEILAYAQDCEPYALSEDQKGRLSAAVRKATGEDE